MSDLYICRDCHSTMTIGSCAIEMVRENKYCPKCGTKGLSEY